MYNDLNYAGAISLVRFLGCHNSISHTPRQSATGSRSLIANLQIEFRPSKGKEPMTATAPNRIHRIAKESFKAFSQAFSHCLSCYHLGCHPYLILCKITDAKIASTMQQATNIFLRQRIKLSFVGHPKVVSSSSPLSGGIQTNSSLRTDWIVLNRRV